MIFYELSLDRLHRNWDNFYGVHFERFMNDDIGLLSSALTDMDFQSEFTINEATERLKRGYLLYVAKKRRKIIGFIWLAVNDHLLPYFNGTLYLHPAQVYGFNGYMHKDLRGLGIYNKLRSYAYRDVQKMSYKSAVGLIYAWNKAAIRAEIRLGFVPIGYISFGYCASIRFFFNSVKKNKITLHDEPLILWRKLYKRLL